MALTFECCYVSVGSVVALVRSANVIINWCGVSVFSVSPSSFIQLRQSSGCVCFVVISCSSCFDLPSNSLFAKVLPSNFILLSFTSRKSSNTGLISVILLNFSFGINVTGEPLSMMNVIGQLLTISVLV